MDPIELVDQLKEQFPAAGVVISFKEKPASEGRVDYTGLVRTWGMAHLQAMGTVDALRRILSQLSHLDYVTYGGKDDLPPSDVPPAA
jgi:hypothetical protein